MMQIKQEKGKSGNPILKKNDQLIRKNVAIKLNSGRKLPKSETTHATHHAEHVVVGGVHPYLGGVGARHGRVRQNHLEGDVVDAAEV